MGSARLRQVSIAHTFLLYDKCALSSSRLDTLSDADWMTPARDAAQAAGEAPRGPSVRCWSRPARGSAPGSARGCPGWPCGHEARRLHGAPTVRASDDAGLDPPPRHPPTPPTPGIRSLCPPRGDWIFLKTGNFGGGREKRLDGDAQWMNSGGMETIIAKVMLWMGVLGLLVWVAREYRLLSLALRKVGREGAEWKRKYEEMVKKADEYRGASWYWQSMYDEAVRGHVRGGSFKADEDFELVKVASGAEVSEGEGAPGGPVELGKYGIGVTEASGDSEHPGRPIDPRRFTEIAPGPEGKRDAGGLQEGGAS